MLLQSSEAIQNDVAFAGILSRFDFASNHIGHVFRQGNAERSGSSHTEQFSIQHDSIVSNLHGKHAGAHLTRIAGDRSFDASTDGEGCVAGLWFEEFKEGMTYDAHRLRVPRQRLGIAPGLAVVAR